MKLVESAHASEVGRVRSVIEMLLLLETGQLHEVTQKPHLERSIAVNRDRDPDRAASLSVNVMASIDAL